MNCKSFKTVKPSPFFNIVVGGSNRMFYDHLNNLGNICDLRDVEFDENVCRQCDYEGDLEKLIIYAGSVIIQDVIKYYEIPYIPDDNVNVIISIFPL